MIFGLLRRRNQIEFRFTDGTMDNNLTRQFVFKDMTS